MRCRDGSRRRGVAVGAAILAVLLTCAACGSQKPVYGFTRQVTVDLTGTQTLQGTFHDHNLSPVAEACAWSVHPSRFGHGGVPYPPFGGTDGVLVAGTRFSATFRPALRAPEVVQATITLQIGDVYYFADPGTVRLKENGSGELVVDGASQESGTGSVSGTVSWTCRNQS